MTGQVSIRCLRGRPGEAGEWLRLIHGANAHAEAAGEPLLFGEPTEQGPWWAGGEVEEYDDARVIFRSDPTVSIVAKTERGARHLAIAARDLGIRYVGCDW